MVGNGQSSANPNCGDTYTYQFPVGEGRSFFCHPSLRGKYVIIRFVDKDKPLTLCEVEVYSERRGMMHEIYINKTVALKGTVHVFGVLYTCTVYTCRY